MPAPFKGSILNCKICGSTFKVPPSRALTAEFCSIECSAEGRGRRMQKRVTLQCPCCGKEFDAPQSHAARRVYCSNACRERSVSYMEAKSARMAREANPAWRGGVVDHSDGYVYFHAPDHPFASGGYVLAHRLVMEEWLRENDPASPFLIRLGDRLYLSPDFIVHHDDENKRRNVIGNLVCLTIAEHNRLHAARRNSKGSLT